MAMKLRCEVLEVIDHGEAVYSVTLRPERRAPRFLPGQFLHLALDDFKHGDFWPDSRVFSIASPPAERDTLRITYAVKGSFTGRMQAELRPGLQVWVKLPYGEFTVRTDGEVCLLAGGTGVTAFTGFLAGLDGNCSQRVSLFYGARRPELLIYRPLIESAAGRCPNLKAWFLAEQEAEAAECRNGRIDIAAVWQALPAPMAVDYYLSGPPEMLRALATQLKERGAALSQIHIDAWE